jgi:hypothetical protein
MVYSVGGHCRFRREDEKLGREDRGAKVKN